MIFLTSMHQEAEITISGVRLTEGQSITVRTAIQSFAISLAHEGLGEDVAGKYLVDSYLQHIREINHLIGRTAS